MGFAVSNKYGRSGEKVVLSLLQRYNYPAVLNDNKNERAFYDIAFDFSPKKKVLIECKFDMMCCQTGNVCVEYHNPKSDKPSGINVTKADIYSYIILDMGNPTVWFASVDKLKNFLKTVKPYKTIEKGGDKNSSFHLYNHEVILPAVFHRVENLAEEKQFHDIIKLLTQKKKENK